MSGTADLTQLKASLIAEISDYVTDFEKAGQVAIQFGKAQKRANENVEKSATGIDKAAAMVNKYKTVAIAGAAAVAGFAYSAKQAWDAAKEGAQLELTETQFRNVATAADMAADALLVDMRRATSGMVTDAELIKSGLDIIELGLADSHDGVVDLANAIATLGLDQQQVILTFSNNSKARLDSLGLSVESVTKRVRELNAQGFDGDAFDQAVLEGLTKRMEVLGDTAETNAGQMAMLDTEWKNLTNTGKTLWASLVGPGVKSVNEIIEVQRAHNAAVEEGFVSGQRLYLLHDALNKGIINQKQFIDLLNAAQEQHNQVVARANDISYLYASSTDWLGATINAASDSSYRYGQAQDRATNAVERGVEVQKRMQAEAEATAGIIDTLAGATANLDGSFANNTSMAESMLQEWEWTQAGGAELQQRIEEIGQLKVEPEVKKELLQEALAASVELDVTLGNIQEKEGAQLLKDAFNLETLEEASALLSDGNAGILDDLERLDSSIYTATTEIIDKTAEIRAALLSTVAQWEGFHYGTFVARYETRGRSGGNGGGSGGGSGDNETDLVGGTIANGATGGIHYHLYDQLAYAKLQEIERQNELNSLSRIMQ
jgi:hypothetical protein